MVDAGIAVVLKNQKLSESDLDLIGRIKGLEDDDRVDFVRESFPSCSVGFVRVHSGYSFDDVKSILTDAGLLGVYHEPTHASKTSFYYKFGNRGYHLHFQLAD